MGDRHPTAKGHSMRRDLVIGHGPGWRRGALLLLVAVMGAPAANADLLTPSSAWTRLTVPNEPATEFRWREDGGLAVRADNAVAFVHREVEPDAHAAVASWRWRLDQGIPPTDQARRGGDDRPVAVHLWFDTGNDDETLHGTMARLWGYPTVTHALTYVWGGTRPAGTFLENPYYKRGELIVLQPSDAPTGAWMRERRDIAADLKRAFGDGVQVSDLDYVAISADTDDTDTRSRALLNDLRLQPRQDRDGS
jgi:hypothetical protein